MLSLSFLDTLAASAVISISAQSVILFIFCKPVFLFNKSSPCNHLLFLLCLFYFEHPSLFFILILFVKLIFDEFSSFPYLLFCRHITPCVCCFSRDASSLSLWRTETSFILHVCPLYKPKFVAYGLH